MATSTPGQINGHAKTFLDAFKMTPKPVYGDANYEEYEKIIKGKSKKMFDLAHESFTKKDFHQCVRYLYKALLMEPYNVELYCLRGDAYLALLDFKSAIQNYKKVCILEPTSDAYFSRLAHFYFLHGTYLYKNENVVDALDCFMKASEMKTDSLEYHNKCIECLITLKKYDECLALVNNRVQVESSNPDHFVRRAQLHLIFCNSTLSYYDVKTALSLQPKHTQALEMKAKLMKTSEQLKEEAVKLDLKGSVREAITKMSQAIKVFPESIGYHLLRASMYRRDADFNACVNDILDVIGKTEKSNPSFVQAQKQLILVFNDFAVKCFNEDSYEEAVLLLDKAIKGEKTNEVLYMNRGDCFHKMGNLHFALCDYKQAEELRPGNKNVMSRLSVVFGELAAVEHEGKRYLRAEEYLSMAIANNPANAEHYLSRSRARYMQQKFESAKVDIISCLHFDVTNKKVLSLFHCLFPAQCVSEVVESETGTLVSKALEEMLKEVAEGLTSERYLDWRRSVPDQHYIHKNMKKANDEYLPTYTDS